MAETAFLLDAYVEPQDVVLQRASWMMDAYDHHGFTPTTAIMVGGSALAMARLSRAYLGPNDPRHLDLDVAVPDETVMQLEKAAQEKRRTEEVELDFFSEDYGHDRPTHSIGGEWPVDFIGDLKLMSSLPTVNF